MKKRLDLTLRFRRFSLKRFIILLSEAGYQVNAVDYTEAMLEEAKKMQEHSHKRSHIVRWMPVILHLWMKHLMQ